MKRILNYRVLWILFFKNLNNKKHNINMENLFAILFVVIFLGLPIATFFSSEDKDGEDPAIFLFLFLTIFCFWIIERYEIDYYNLSGCYYPGEFFPNGELSKGYPVLFQYTTGCTTSGIGDFFWRILMEIIEIWPLLVVLYWGMFKTVIGEGWTENQWLKYGFINFIIWSLIMYNDFLFDLI